MPVIAAVSVIATSIIGSCIVGSLRGPEWGLAVAAAGVILAKAFFKSAIVQNRKTMAHRQPAH
jgi:hypothetical protein